MPPPHALRPAVAGLITGLVVLAAGGCTSPPSSGPTPATQTGAGSPTVSATSAPATASRSDSPSATPSVENSYTPPARTPGRPDPSTAGRLSAKTFPNPVLGFTGTVVEPDEGEYNANGTWVHALDGAQAAYESMPQCAAVAFSQVPKPRAALSGTYRDAAGNPGNALGLQFADTSAARTFFTLYAGQLRACPSSGGGMPTVTELSVSGTVVTGRRTYSAQEKWSEIIKRDGSVVVMIILADQHRTSPTRLADTAAQM